MSVAIPPLPQYAFIAWCSVKAQGQLYLLPLSKNESKEPNFTIANFISNGAIYYFRIKKTWRM
jgi:hypothetical protein